MTRRSLDPALPMLLNVENTNGRVSDFTDNNKILQMVSTLKIFYQILKKRRHHLLDLELIENKRVFKGIYLLNIFSNFLNSWRRSNIFRKRLCSARRSESKRRTKLY